jgi:hypothetical protein
MAKLERIQALVDRREKRKLDALAADAGRSVAAELRMAVRAWLDLNAPKKDGEI